MDDISKSSASADGGSNSACSPASLNRDFRQRSGLDVAGCAGAGCEGIERVDADDWNKPAYAIGVLSHYFTDPMMPLHTAQHPDEAAVHRPLEWSVCKAYDAIYRKCTGQVEFPIDSGAGWISRAVLTEADIAHPHYRQLSELYDLKKGAQDPPKGLNSEARMILAELFDYVLTGWARILDRIAITSLRHYQSACRVVE